MFVLLTLFRPVLIVLSKCRLRIPFNFDAFPFEPYLTRMLATHDFNPSLNPSPRPSGL